MRAEHESHRVTQNMSTQLRGVLENILKDNEGIIEDITEIRTIKDWYSEAKTDPKKIPSILMNGILEKILDIVVTSLQDYLVDSISAKINIQKDRIEIEELEIDFSVKPYVKFIKKINSTRSSEIKLTFGVGIAGMMEKIVFENDADRKMVSIDKLAVALTMSLVSIEIKLVIIPEVNFVGPKELCRSQILEMHNLVIINSAKNTRAPIGPP